MPDLVRIKQNVAKMASMNAPEKDIDGYISSEGVSVDDVRNFNQYQGGANSSANVQAQEDLRKAQMQAQPLSVVAKGLDMASAPAQNTSLFGLPEIMSQKMTGKSFIPEDAQMQGLSSALGFAGGPAMAGKAASGLVKAVGVGGNIGRAALGGATSLGSVLSSPKEAPTMQSAINQQAGKAAIGAGLGVAGELIGMIPKAFNGSSSESQVALAEKVRRAAYQAKTDTVNQFGDGVDELAKANPEASVSLKDPVDSLKTNMNDMAPEAKAVFRRTPILKNMLEEPTISTSKVVDGKTINEIIPNPNYINPNSVKLRDTQDIINYINTKVPKNIKYNHLDILDTLNDVRAAQLDAFPEMEGVRAKYGDFINSFNNIKSKLKVGSLIGNMSNDFGDAEIKKHVSNVFQEDLLKEIQNFRNAQQTLKVAGIVGKTLGYGALAGVGLGGAEQAVKKVIH